MKTISLWRSVTLFSFVSLTLVSYLENGYQEELLSAEVLQEAISQAKADDTLVKRELLLLSANSKNLTKSVDK